MNLDQRLEFIDSLPSLPVTTARTIKPFAPKPAVVIDPAKPSATVGEEMINLFLAGVSEQNRKDVNRCKQLVQNAATRRYDPEKELHQWFKYYTETLAKLGWVTQAVQNKDETIKRTGLTMDIVAAYVMQGFVGANYQKLAAMATKGVNIIKNDKGLVDIYNRTANVGSETKFDISPVWETKEGYPMMILNCNSVDVRESSRGILWWKSTTQQTKIKSGALAVYLNVDDYSDTRNLILSKIGKTAQEALADIDNI